MDDLDVPGTSRILDEDGQLIGSNNYTLVPTPSRDPNDPLNWSQRRKWLFLSCVVLYAVAICFLVGSLYAIYEPLSEATGLSLADLNAGIGYVYLCQGIFPIFTQPLGLAIGKRPTYIISTLASTAFPFWLTHAKSNGEWIGCCIVFGLFSSLLFTTCELSVSDVFFYHERALPMGIWVAAQYGGALLAPVMSGYIYTGLGWRAPPYFAGGFSFLTAIYLILFMEESNFRRELVPEASTEVEVVHVNATHDENKDRVTTDDKTAERIDPTVHSFDRVVSPWPGPRPWIMFKISPNAKGVLYRGVLYPIMLLRHPIVLWCGLIMGLYQIFFNLMVALCSGTLSAEPYNFKPNSVGLTFISPLIAVAPGAIAGGWISDRFTIYQARKNHGISEAEHKLKLFLLPTILTPFGLLMIGLGPYYEAHWMVFVAGEFVLTICGPLAALLAISYAFDSFHAMRPDKSTGPQAEVQDTAPYLLSLIAICMLFTFAFNYVITPWAFGWGFKNFAISAACIAVAVNLTHFGMIRWGKKLRRGSAAYYRRVINW